jgi:CBS domain-containing protein
MRPVGPGFFVEPSTTLDSAQAVMKENGVGAIAVVNGSGKLVGFLQGGRLKRRDETKSR